MFGVNPLLAQAAASGAIDTTTAILQAIASDAAALNALLQEGDVFQATVLPFNGVTDLIEAFGLQVPASLPPGIYPGEQIQLQVQGFQGDQIMVKLVGTQPAAGGTAPPAEPATLELTSTPVPVVVDPESLPGGTAPSPGAPPGAGQAPQGAGGSAPPSSAVPPPIQTLPRAAIPPIQPRTAGPSAPASPAAANAARSAAPPSPESLSVEARLALTRATLLAPQRTAPLERGAPTPLPPVPSRAAPGGASNLPPAAGRAGAPPPPVAQTRPAYLPIAERGAAEKPPSTPLPGAPVPVRGALSIPAAPPGARPPAITASSLLSDPAALLRALRIPVTPTSLAFAKLATTQPEQVATALRALETGLPDGSDPRVQTLRTLATFVGNLDPESPTFPTQVASFMSHVAEGPEPKLLAALLMQGEPEPESPPAAPGAQPEASPAAGETAPQSAPAPAANAPAANAPAAAEAPPPAVPVDPAALAAQSVMRTAAAAADLKTQILGILATPGGSDSVVGDAGTALIQNALTAIASSQLNSLASQQTGSGSWTFTLPIAIDQQIYPAKILIDRDAPDSKKGLTGDDFHIAFILETQHLGTVAIDVRAVGRAVNVAVKTEREIAAASFKQSLAQLGERLEAMKYNVRSLDAGALPVRIADGAPDAEEKTDAAPATDPNALMDKRA